MRRRMFGVGLLFAGVLWAWNAGTAQTAAQYAVPEVRGPYGAIPGKFTEYAVVLEPDKDAAEWWAGAPSVVRDARGVFWMACRMRTADAPRGLRGYEVRILRSEDGIKFRKVHHLLREQVPIPGFERPSMLVHPRTGRFMLYGCGPWKGGQWSIIRFDDADDPTQFVPSTARVVIKPQENPPVGDAVVTGYKDPVVIFANGKFHCFVIGVLRTERIFHFQSDDGETWVPVGHPSQSMMELSGWHDFFVRPASVLPLGPGYLFIYEGSNSRWKDPPYQIATGLGFTFDLEHVQDLTPQSPLIVSTTPSADFRTWRYSQWMHVGDEVWVYAEAEKPNGAHQIRLFRLKR